MAGKRKALTETPTPDAAKRQRVDDDLKSPSSQTPSARTLTADDRAKLVLWLDKQSEKTSGIPFPITYAPSTPAPKKGRSRKSIQKSRSTSEQLSLDGRDYISVEYNIGNKAKWEDLTKFRRCTFGDELFEPGECLLVKGDSTTDADPDDPEASLKKWKAQLHEIRALDENHVYLRVTWLYRPQHDLPDGPKWYHGRYELIPSTEMQIIDAMSVDGKISVKFWKEDVDDDVPEAGEYYFRQTYDHTSRTLSSCRLVCSCSRPQNLDYPIFQCQHCTEWMHGECIEREAVRDIVGEDAVEQEVIDDTGVVNGTTPTRKKAAKRAKTKTTPAKGKGIQNGNTQAEPNVVAKLEFDSPASEGNANGASSSHSQHGTSRLVVTDRRGEEPVERTTEVHCLFCRKNIDG